MATQDFAVVRTSEGGRMVASLPATPSDPQVWTLTYMSADGVVFEDASVPLLYDIVFGPDAEDVKRMDDRVTELFRQHGVKE